MIYNAMRIRSTLLAYRTVSALLIMMAVVPSADLMADNLPSSGLTVDQRLWLESCRTVVVTASGSTCIGQVVQSGVDDHAKSQEWRIICLDELSDDQVLVALHLGALTGNGDAQRRLASLYYHGDRYGVLQDYSMAWFWTFTAAIAGYHDAQAAVGRMYGFGEGVERHRVSGMRSSTSPHCMARLPTMIANCSAKR